MVFHFFFIIKRYYNKPSKKTLETYIFLTFFLCLLKIYHNNNFLEQRRSHVGWPSIDRSTCRKIKITKLINRVFYPIVAFKYPIEIALRAYAAVLLSITRLSARSTKKKKEKNETSWKKREEFPL